MDIQSKKTPLYERHRASGARMVDFAGWYMPVQYSGIIAEHIHTRSAASVFDVCHMGEFTVKGPGAGKEVDRLVTCGIRGMAEGKCRYGFLLNEKGTIIDDLITFKISPEEYMLVVNAGTAEKDAGWIKREVGSGVEFADISAATAKIDLQGPRAPDVMERVLDDRGIRSLGRFNFIKTDWRGTELLVSATGYTGEKGYEIFLPAEEAAGMWDALTACDGVAPAGLGARDSLRLEMGYSLYGHEIDDEHTPLEAGLSRFVDMDKDFTGKKALEDRERSGFPRVLAGFVCEGRRSAKHGFDVMAGSGASGVVTSGVFSPCLKLGVGLCYIDKGSASEGTAVTLTDGKVEIAARIKKPPFIRTGLG